MLYRNRQPTFGTWSYSVCLTNPRLKHKLYPVSFHPCVNTSDQCGASDWVLVSCLHCLATTEQTELPSTDGPHLLSSVI